MWNLWTVYRFGRLQNVIRLFLSKCKTVARILIGSGCIFYSFSGDTVRHLQIWSLCDSYDRLTVAHALLSCASLEPLRSVSWAAATQSMPCPLAESLGSLCDNEKMIMLLSGLNCPYITEWHVIYEDIITFLATMYTKFKANLDRLWFPTSCSQYLEMSQ